MTWSTSSALQQIRLSLNLNQRTFGERLSITPAHVSLLEAGKKSPSKMLLKLVSHEFKVNLDWLETGTGEPFLATESQKNFEKLEERKKMKKRIMLTSALLVPLLPAAAAGLAIGVGVDEILHKMQRAYGAKTMSDLATNFLKTDVSALSRWKSKGKIPEKYLEKIHQDKGTPPEYLLCDVGLIEEGRQEIIHFISDLMEKNRKNKINEDDIERLFRKKFPLFPAT